MPKLENIPHRIERITVYFHVSSSPNVKGEALANSLPITEQQPIEESGRLAMAMIAKSFDIPEKQLNLVYMDKSASSSTQATPTPAERYELETMPGHLLRAAYHSHNSLWQEIVDGEITSIQFAILNILANNIDKLDQTQIGRAAQIDRSTLSQTLNRLERIGLVSKDRDTLDRRRSLLSLTPAGRREHDRLHPLVLQLQETILNHAMKHEHSAESVMSLLACLREMHE
ncbi:MAG: MarR family transcriptional regulator [Gordonia sp. (in: high G+C Gram-positive bacteria)]